MINADELVARARALLTKDDPAAKFPETDIFASIPACLAQWKQTLGANRKITATTANIAITNGVAAVKPAIEAVGIYRDRVKKAEIYIAYPGQPALAVDFVNSRDRVLMPGIQDAFYVKAYFDGVNMYFGTINNVPISGVSFTITEEANPSDLSMMPADCIGELTICLADIVRKFNTDMEHKGVTRRTAQK